MNRFKVSFFIIPYLVFFTSVLYSQEINKIAQQADSMYAEHEENQALKLYTQILNQNPDHYKALWRSSFLYSRIGNRLEDKDEQKEYFNQAIDIAERALAVDSTDSQSNFVMAVAMGRKALVSGARDRVAASRDIKKYADRALEIDSTNSGAWHVLGRWHLKVANLSWVERLAANTLFGGVPGDASNEKAAESIQKAISLNDQYIRYHYDLAQVYHELGRDKQAIETCQKAIELPVLTADDVNLKKKCEEFIQSV